MNYVFYLTDKYRVNVINTTQCQLSNAQCEKIDNKCICHCHHDFIMVNGSCLKGNICRNLKMVHVEDCHIVA